MFKYLIFSTFTFLLCAYENITPIPLTPEYDKAKATLGKKLFFDPLLSKDETISCQSCHTLPGSGANPTAFSFGVDAQEGNTNSPTVLNASFNFSQFWDGRAKTLHEQALFPLTDPLEMAETIENVIRKLKNSPYNTQFNAIYKDGVTQTNILNSIEEFEKALTTPNSRFDRYLRGDEKAITTQEKRGYKRFKEVGCISCHNGVNIGGNMYQKIGLIIPYNHTDKQKFKQSFNGRYNVTNRERDRQVFKVPTLRNIELTAPYFHDGSVKTLRDTIIDMREHQLGITTIGSGVDDIEAFLKTLTGEVPAILKEDER